MIRLFWDDMDESKLPLERTDGSGMIRKERNGMKHEWKGVAIYSPGLVLILMGLIIWAFPMLLVAFVSALLVLVGVIAMAAAYHMRRIEKEMDRIGDREGLEGSFWDRAEKLFSRRPWH